MNMRLKVLLTLASVLGLSQSLNAAGFFLIEHSVSAMGNAYAGASANPEDPSHVFFNPALSAHLCGLQTASGTHVVIPFSQFHDHGSRAALPPPIGSHHLRGNDGGDLGVIGYVSHWGITKRCGCWGFALNLNTPFGLETNYDDHWKGRYHANHSKLLTININPSVSYRFNRCWSFGAGFSAQYLHAKLTNKVDFGSIAFAASGGQVGNPQHNDGKAYVKGNSWGYGGNAGILWEPNCRTLIGLSYRSEIRHHIEGKEDIDDVPIFTGSAAAAFVNAFLAATFHDTRAKADVTLPQLVSLSGVYRLNNCWTILGDVTWMKWDVIKRLRFRFDNPLQPDAITTLHWQNTWRYALGVTYEPNCCWKFRTGVAYDETPQHRRKFWSVRIPDEDRVWATVGVGYRWNRCLHFDFGYAHLFVRDAHIDQRGTLTPDNENFFRGALRGKWEGSTDIVSVQWGWNF